ncbi:protease pro-enzyme activation domain-containing protein [Pullulanibacillus sp. KACC 23026]|uniref:S53 family peptidase n=1 Tax=Pullulanibacillus sp. KACC 23026 TaxID=3028315 RepID=UPI0023AF7D14|nr:protease pro-enzyme activation domain-containing protein [Pullulanibacillus sp. KACC 23026]WEG13130.1 protease pro-enzyme activation domain-containing protein [Pullulanibacillus sp. KACC 23026]
MSLMRRWKRKMLTVAAASALAIGVMPLSTTHAATGSAASSDESIQQGVGQDILSNANYFGDMDPSAVVQVDIVMKVQNQSQLQKYINETVTPGNKNYHKYLSVDQFKDYFAPSTSQVKKVTDYLKSFGIKSSVYKDNLIITATGTVAQLNKAFSVDIQKAGYKGKSFHATRKAPRAPKKVADNILCILGLSNYSNLTSNAVKQKVDSPAKSKDSSYVPGELTPQDLIKQYNVQGLYDEGATGKGQTIGIVTLADFNTQDANTFWDKMGIKTKPNRISKINVDGGSGWDGYDETAIDVEQSGALAPDANINVYVAPNTDTGFVDGFAKAINDNVAQQISVSWGMSETLITQAVEANQETPEYADVYNQLFMQAAAQGISMFAAAGDAGAYDTARQVDYYDLSVDNPADSPYITAAGGTTLPQDWIASTGDEVKVDKERAWGWDYLFPLLNDLGLGMDSGYYISGGGGGFSKYFATPDYQKGVKGVNKYTGVTDFTISSDLTTATVNSNPTLVKGTGKGRNVPDLSMNADPESGYLLYLGDAGTGDNGGFQEGWGGTSFVAPQLNGLSALINSVNGGRVGFWNPQIYRFAKENNSPLTPLNDQGTSNDNLFFTGTPGTLYNQATGLGTPDVTALAKHFFADGKGNNGHGHGHGRGHR